MAHTPDDAAITISAAAATTSGDEATVTLTIEEGGPGVPTEQLSSLFERFKRATSRPEGSRRGLGIGLSVVRGLVESMGGQVAAAPASIGGLAVIVTLSQAPADPDR